MNEWRVEELSEQETEELNENKADLPSCQDSVPEGELGFGEDQEPGWDIEAHQTEEEGQ